VNVCSGCGHENSDDAQFCSQCASALVDSVGPRTERKVVTVLFSDLVGFTARSELLDPEDVRAMLTAYHDRVRAELERHGGTVEKLVGDGVMALFGAPVAHEDDPERAVRAALAIRDGLAELDRDDPTSGLHVRIGINTGEVLVELPTVPGAGETTPAGDVVNTAARLETAAAPGGILVGEATYRATERAIAYRERPPVEAKGKAHPVAAWEALEPRARVGIAVRQMSSSPLVGRTWELDVLVGALARVRQESAPQLVTLVGVPGIGKSRLVWELYRHADAEPDFISWRQGRSLPYGDGVAFWALAEMAKAQTGILETDTDEEAREKLRTAVACVRDEDRGRVESRLAPLVGLEGDDDTTDRRDETFGAWRRWLEALAEDRPLVLVFEDLHWADDQLLDFVDHLVEWVGSVPLLVVCTARPEFLLRRPGWGGGMANATTLTLSPLSDDETATLIHLLLERSVLPAELQAELLDRAAGNPLYAEEFVRMAAQRAGLEALPLPGSVQGLIAARIDALPPDEKSLLQDAAVVGRVFWPGALAALAAAGGPSLSEDRLHALERKEFIRRERRSSVAGETAYAFCHALIRDVAYGQIPRVLRVEKHRAAAEWLGSLGRSEDHAEMLAHHYVRALELAESAGQDTRVLVGRARRALRQAGDRSAGLNAFVAAAKFYREALELWPVDDPERPKLLFKYGSVLFVGQQRGEPELNEAAAGLIAAGDHEVAAVAEVMLAELAWHEARRADCDRHIEHAAALVADSPPSFAKTKVLAGLARSYMLAGRSEDAIRVGSEVLALSESLGLDELRAMALSYVGSARLRLGDMSGLDEAREAVRIAREINSPHLARWVNNVASMLSEIGEHREAFALWDEAEEIARRDGAFAIERFIRGLQSFNRLAVGRWDEALELAEEFLAGTRDVPHYLDGGNYEARSVIRLARDDPEGAREDAHLGLAAGRRARDPQALGPMLVHHAAVLVELGDLETADAEADEILEMCSAGTVPPLLPISLVVLVFERLGRGDDLLRVREVMNPGRWRDALDLHLAGDPGAAADLAEETGVLSGAAWWRLLAGRILAESGRHSEADVQLEKALAFFRTVGAPRYIRQTESLLSATA